MTYLVLARKWRPRSFDTLIGQDHVVRALTHALSTQRLHHAWLFTGTRGVGKTTLSRLLAKALNCESGITATPCGSCRPCTEIDSGRFVDYVELDAASNRGVDEMTQLLEQAVYAPGSGRFKVYMIDEVHMLTGHAFNAMLKTLEEPPPHVKFILATTDPQKIPVTVLSRCLQFNLKQMTAPSIVEHLQHVLGQEHIQFEMPALRLLAQAASGSMRDALSLTDQAIAYSAGNLTNEAVQGMLGTIDQKHLADLLAALAQGSATHVLQVADDLALRGLSYTGALGDLAVLLSRIAIEQRLPGTMPEDDPLVDDVRHLAAILHPDQVQLFYSVAVHSRHELSLAPDEYAGFVMACLRMLALGPAQHEAAPQPESKSQRQPNRQAEPEPEPTLEPEFEPEPESTSGPQSVREADQLRVNAVPASATASRSTPAPAPSPAAKAAEPSADHSPHTDVPAWEDAPAEAPVVQAAREPASSPPPVDDDGGFESFDLQSTFEEQQFEPLGEDELPEPSAAELDVAVPVFSKGKKAKNPRLRDMTPQAWPSLAAKLPLTGLAAELARQSEWVGSKDDEAHLRVAIRTLAESPGKARLCTVLSEHFGTVVQLHVEYGATGDETAHAVAEAQKALRQQQAEEAAANDPFVKTMIRDFGARIVPGSVSAAPADLTTGPA